MKQRILLFASLVCMGFAPVFADSLVDSNGQALDGAHVDAFVVDSGRAMFLYRKLEGEALSAPLSPLMAEQLKSGQFRSLWDSSSGASAGRIATLITRSGARLEGLAVESFVQTPEGPVFQIREAGVPAGGKAFPVKCGAIEALLFDPMLRPGTLPTPPPVQVLPPDGAPGAQPGGQAFPGAYAPQPAAPAAGYAAQPQYPPSGESGVVPEDLGQPARLGGGLQSVPAELLPKTGLKPPPGGPGTQTKSEEYSSPYSGSENSGNSFSGAGGSPQSPSSMMSGDPSTDVSDALVALASDLDKERKAAPTQIYNDLQNQYGVGFLGKDKLSADQRYNPSSGVMLNVFGFDFGLLPILIGMVLAFVAGGTSLYYSSRGEGETPLPISKTIITSALLTTIPPALFLTPIYFLPFKGVASVVGLFTLYFAARAIVMGMVEVLEGKAAAIVIWFYVSMGLGVWLAVKILPS